MTTVRNPVIRGFHPDPSILRVGDDYYIATSTFEFHPGVRIHHSRDLAAWEVVGHVLGDDFELRGVPDSGGVWAPSLSFADGRYWLAYSIVRSLDGDDLDIDNYVVTADDVRGPWTPPVYLGSRGFDFSFFHDDDGTHWVVGVQWDQRPEHPSFGGLVLEQYSPSEQRCSGEVHLLYSSTGLVEGPNIYHVDDWYYLLIAEGGTGWNHGITVARSRSRTGPYERDNRPATLTSRDDPGAPLQKAGHGELVQTQSGEWVLVHLASRPVLHQGERYSILGRETCVQRVVFDDDGWPRLADGGHHAQVDVEFEMPGQERTDRARSWREDFRGSRLDGRRWSTLRAAVQPETADLQARPGWLRLRGGRSPASVFDQSMILTRVEEHHAEMSAVFDAEPRSPREMAGIIAWYDRNGWIWAQLGWDAQHGRHLRIVYRDGTRTSRSKPVSVTDGPVRLHATLNGPDLRFRWSTVSGDEGADVPGTYPAWTLAEDHGDRLRFTGMFLGVRVDDLDSGVWMADIGPITVAFSEPSQHWSSET